MKGPVLFFILFATLQAALISGCAAQPNSQAAAMQGKADTYLVKDDTVRFNFAILDQGVATYASAADKSADRPECLITWNEVPAFQRMLAHFTAEEALVFYLAKGKAPWETALTAQWPSLPAGLPEKSSAAKPLTGVRVALDPGHLGGDMDFAKDIEKKYVRIRKNPAKGIPEDIAFNEGNLALATGIELKRILEEAGAEVLLTRQKQGHCALGYDFETWLDMEVLVFETGNGPIGPDGFAVKKANDADGYKLNCAAANYIWQENLHGEDSLWWTENNTKRNIYRIPFLKMDFKERAARINAFQPHMTLIIHYNIYEKNDPDRNGYLSPVPQNYCMAFIPGSFMAGELGTPEERLAFLGKLLTDDLKKSEALCDAVLQQHVQQLGVPIKDYDQKLRYLGKASLETKAPGVFARNLSLTRLVNGPMCFGESLYQDNIDEAMRLNQKDYTPKGMTTPVPFRVKEVALAYFDGVVNWVNGK